MQLVHLKIIEKKETDRIKVHKVTISMIILFNAFYITGNTMKNRELIYILEWTPTHAEPFNFLEQEQKAFETRKCAFKNCFLTSNNTYFSNILDFDVIMFNAVHMKDVTLPTQRAQSQKYIMVAMEPAGYYPLDAEFNDFFNFTWTYKLDSDVPFPYIIIKNQLGEVIGPKIDMRWIKIQDMNETSDYVKHKLRKKYIAAASFVSNCMSYKRLNFAYDLKNELAKYGHRLDIYGKCGNYQCPMQATMDECFALIESDYYFYLAFENSFGADYVSEKLLHALEHFAVPVVLGGANYSRFMPDGIYLDALSLEPAELAITISEIINETDNYYEFFKWHGYYSFHFTGEDAFHREVCGLCELLNNKSRMHQTTVFSNITHWWNEENPTNRDSGEYFHDGRINLILEDEFHETGVKELVSKLYNYVFE